MNQLTSKFICLLMAVMPAAVANAQHTTLSGQVNNSGQAVAGVTLSIRTQKDSALVAGTVSAENGRYSFENIDTGRYILQASAIGYQKYLQAVHIQSPTTIWNISLEASDGTYLNTVSITASRPFITRSIDQLTVNIEGSIYSQGENGLRLFNVIPGVRVDPVGGIQFRGGQPVTVYIDNRKLNLSGQQLMDYLRSIPSESIESYQLQAVPGAAYDAQNSGTIINVVLKNSYKYGLSGSLGSTVKKTRYLELDENATLNYRAGRFTLQGSFAWYGAKQFLDNDESQHTYSVDQYNDQVNRWTAKVKYHSGKFGIDYRISDKQTFGANYDFGVARFDSFNDSRSAISTLTNRSVANSTTLSTNQGDNNWVNRMASGFYRNKLDSASKLDVGYSYIGYHNSVLNQIRNQYFSIANEVPDSLFSDNPLHIDIHAVNIDLDKQLSPKVTLNAGAKYTYSKTDNAIHYDEASGRFSGLISNQFLYNEHIIALYSSLSKSWEDWQIKAGLRAENYNYSGRSVTSKDSIGSSRWDLFPSLYLQRTLGKSHTLTLSSARRINRPDFRQLNPFVEVSNPYYIEQGNPDLLPYYSYSTELEYQLKSKYSFTIGYQFTKDAINTIYRNQRNVVIAKAENLNDNSNTFLTVNIPVKVADFWEISSSFSMRYTWVSIPSQNFGRSKLSEDLWLLNRIKLPAKINLEVSGIYSHNNFIGIYDLNTQYRIDVNFKKRFLKDKLTATLDLGDPFNLYQIGWKVKETDFQRNVIRRLPTRFVSFGISYNFSTGKKSTSREEMKSAAEEAQERLP